MAMLVTAAAFSAAAQHKSGGGSDFNSSGSNTEKSTNFFVFEVVRKAGYFSKEECLGYLKDFGSDGHPICVSKNSSELLLFYNSKNDSEDCFMDIWEHMRELNITYSLREVPIHVKGKDLDKKATLVHSRIGITTYKQFKKWYEGEKYKYPEGHSLLKRILKCDSEGRKL